jgi:hypothetical protein
MDVKRPDVPIPGTPPPSQTPMSPVDRMRSAIARADDALSRALDGLARDNPASIDACYVEGQLGYASDAIHSVRMILVRKEYLEDEDEIDTPLVPACQNADPFLPMSNNGPNDGRAS